MVKPSVPWVCAPHQSSGTGGTTWAASSFLTSRLPTCGPLPWVMTTLVAGGDEAGLRPAWRRRPPRSGRPGWRCRRGRSSRCRPGRAGPARQPPPPRSDRALVPGLDPRSRARHGRCQDLPNAAMPVGNCGCRRRSQAASPVLTPRGGLMSAPFVACRRTSTSRGSLDPPRPARRARRARCRCARRAAAGGGARCAHRRRRCRRTGSAARGSRCVPSSGWSTSITRPCDRVWSQS